MKIGIDIDGTIKQTLAAALQVFNKNLKQNIQMEQVTEYYLDMAYGLTREEGRYWWDKLEAEIYTLGVPLENAAEALQQLVQEGHSIQFVTARPALPLIKEITIQWLQKHHFPYSGQNLHMASLDKGTIAKRLELDLFFEDAPEHLDRLIEMGIDTVVVDAVYNRKYPAAQRIKSWKQGLELVREKSEAKLKRS
jgi:uncharacterized HAD superfamily protein